MAQSVRYKKSVAYSTHFSCQALIQTWKDEIESPVAGVEVTLISIEETAVTDSTGFVLSPIDYLLLRAVKLTRLACRMRKS